MKARTLIKLLLSMVLFGMTGQVLAIPQIQQWQTSNGAKVLFIPTPELPMVNIDISFDAGSARDGDHPGLACLTSSVMDESVGDLDSDARAERLSELGATISHDCGRDMGTVSLRSLTRPDLLAPALDILHKVLEQPRFDPADLERVRAQTLAALQQQEQNPGSVASLAFFRSLYRNHPYAHNALGDKDSIAAMTREQLQGFYQRYYQAANATIAIVGDLDRAAAEKLANGLLDCPQGCAPAPAVTAPEPLEQAVELRLPFPSSQTHIKVGAIGMHRGDPDYFALYVGNHILGGSGLISRLSQQVREKRGLSYSVYSYLAPYRVDGPFLIGLATKAASSDEALAVARDTLARFIADGPSDEELRDAKLNLSGGFPLRIDSNAKLVGYLSVIGFYDLPLDYLDRWVGRIEALSVEQIRDAFRRRIHPKRMVTVVVGNGGGQ